MKFDWTNYLDFAKDQIYPLTGENLNPAEEVVYRIIISRLYYALFCLCRNYLRDVEMDNTVINAYNGDFTDLKQLKITIHKYVINQFHADPTTRNIAIHLKRLKGRRIKADYFDEYENIGAEMITSISYAETAISDLTSLYP